VLALQVYELTGSGWPITLARVAVGGVAAIPLRLERVEQTLLDRPATPTQPRRRRHSRHGRKPAAQETRQRESGHG
jgi:CO/xanthine dehydrogenase FAD-binding subunit